MTLKRCLITLIIIVFCVACSGGGDGTLPLPDSNTDNPSDTDPGNDSNTDQNDNSNDDTNDNTDNGSDTSSEVDTSQCQTAQSVHVDGGSGVDNGSCGNEQSPCATIRQGLDQATSGEVVCVKTGTYNESWLQVPSGVTLVSADGPQAAVIFSGTSSAVRFTSGVNNAAIDGFEVYGTWDQGNAGDGLIRVHDATDITIRNTMAHDAPYDQDVIKVSGQVSGLLIENVIAWNPAHRSDNTNFQEVIDIFGSGAGAGDPPPVSNVTVRGCWLFHRGNVGDWLIYSKIYAEKILYENNIFGPSAGRGWGNAAVGIGTGEAGIPNASAAVVNQAIVRNNIFVGLKGDAAFTIMNADNTWVYNNTFYGNSGAELRSVIMLRGNSHDLGPARIFNNIFVNNHPADSGNTFFWVRDSLPSPWHLHNNLYYDNISHSDTAYGNHATDLSNVDPGLTAPQVPDTSNPSLEMLTTLKNNFTIGSTSTAVDKGVDAIQISGHPNWAPGNTDRRWDAYKAPRPDNGQWDLGINQTE